MSFRNRNQNVVLNYDSNPYGQVFNQTEIGSLKFQKDSVISSENDLLVLSSSISVQSILFELSGNFTHQEGQLYWSEDDKTLEINTEINDVSLQIGQELYIRTTNKTGTAITNGQAVYVSGAQGNRPTISLAKADSSLTADCVIGIATHDIADNDIGYVTTFGLVRYVDTSAYSAGDKLYLSADEAGGLTSTKPDSPNYGVRVGYVVRSNVNDGIILVSIEIGTEISGLHDVLITSIDDKQFLQYDSGSSVWKNVGSVPDFYVTSSLYVSGTITNPDGHLTLSSSFGIATVSGSLCVTENVGVGTLVPAKRLEIYSGSVLATGPYNGNFYGGISLEPDLATNVNRHLKIMQDGVNTEKFEFKIWDTSSDVERTAGILSLLTGGGTVLVGSSLQLSGSGLIRAGNGSASTPTFSFASNTNIGVYRFSTNGLGFSTAGSGRWVITNDGHFVPLGTYQIQADDSSSGENAPGFAFNGDADTGVFQVSSNVLGFSTGGTEKVRIDSVGNVGIGTAAAPEGKLEISTSTTFGSQAVTIDQNDADKPFIDYQGTTGANVTATISTYTIPGSIQGFLQIEVNGTKRWIPFYDDPSA